jgi:hypothetical protein
MRCDDKAKEVCSFSSCRLAPRAKSANEALEEKTVDHSGRNI